MKCYRSNVDSLFSQLPGITIALARITLYIFNRLSSKWNVSDIKLKQSLFMDILKEVTREIEYYISSIRGKVESEEDIHSNIKEIHSKTQKVILDSFSCLKLMYIPICVQIEDNVLFNRSTARVSCDKYQHKFCEDNCALQRRVSEGESTMAPRGHPSLYNFHLFMSSLTQLSTEHDKEIFVIPDNVCRIRAEWYQATIDSTLHQIHALTSLFLSASGEHQRNVWELLMAPKLQQFWQSIAESIKNLKCFTTELPLTLFSDTYEKGNSVTAQLRTEEYPEIVEAVMFETFSSCLVQITERFKYMISLYAEGMGQVVNEKLIEGIIEGSDDMKNHSVESLGKGREAEPWNCSKKKFGTAKKGLSGTKKTLNLSGDDAAKGFIAVRSVTKKRRLEHERIGEENDWSSSQYSSSGDEIYEEEYTEIREKEARHSTVRQS